MWLISVYTVLQLEREAPLHHLWVHHSREALWHHCYRRHHHRPRSLPAQLQQHLQQLRRGAPGSSDQSQQRESDISSSLQPSAGRRWPTRCSAAADRRRGGGGVAGNPNTQPSTTSGYIGLQACRCYQSCVQPQWCGRAGTSRTTWIPWVCPLLVL